MPRPNEDDFDDEDEDDLELTAEEWRVAFCNLEETLNYVLIMATAVTGYPALFFLPDQGEEFPQ